MWFRPSATDAYILIDANNRPAGFFLQLLVTNRGIIDSSVYVQGFNREVPSKPIHNTDLEIIEITNIQDRELNGHNLFLANDSNEISIQIQAGGGVGFVLNAIGFTVDINVPEYISTISITNEDKIYEEDIVEIVGGITLANAEHLQACIYDTYILINIDNDIEIDVTTFVATIDGQKVNADLVSIENNNMKICSTIFDTLIGFQQFDFSVLGRVMAVKSEFNNTISLYVSSLLLENEDILDLRGKQEFTRSYDVFIANRLNIVTFVDYNGTILEIDRVKSGGSATAPENPSRRRHNFVGWDVDFSNITGDLVVTAMFEPIVEEERPIDIPNEGNISIRRLPRTGN